MWHLRESFRGRSYTKSTHYTITGAWWAKWRARRREREIRKTGRSVGKAAYSIEWHGGDSTPRYL